MSIKESNITICGHGSGNPSTKNMKTYLDTRYNMKAPNGKHKGIVSVKRLKALNDSGRTKFHNKYKTIIGRNIYNQNLREYVYKKHNGKYYSDCSSSGMATFKEIGYNVPLLNTAGIYESSLFETVKVKIKNGHIQNPEILKVGDALLFVGSDPTRPLQIGHVEYVYKINKPSSSTKTTTSKMTALTKSNDVSIKTECNLYKKANIVGGTVKKLQPKTKVVLVKDMKSGWSKVKLSNGTKGYVKNSCINKSGLSSYRKATVVADKCVVRRKNKKKSGIVASLKKGTTVTVVSVGKFWTNVKFKKDSKNYDAFIFNKRLKINK